MLTTLITSKTRIKLLLKFFLNANTSGYLKNLESEFEDSSNGIRIELNKFENAGLLVSENKGNKKIYRANIFHPLYKDIHNIIMKYAGIDKVIDDIVKRLGNVNLVYLLGAFARGLESKVIDIVIIGDIDREYLLLLIDKVEVVIEKKIRFIIYTQVDFDENREDILNQDHFLLWNVQHQLKSSK
jgi:predicted nucleotidyltransferase